MPKLPSSTGSILLAAALAVTSASCAAPPSSPAPGELTPAELTPAEPTPGAAATTPSARSVDGYPVIVRLAGRHQTITVTAGPGAPLYSAVRADGTPIVAAATLAQLRRDHPAVYEQLVPSVATEHDAAGPRREPKPAPGAGADASLGAYMLMSAD